MLTKSINKELKLSDSNCNEKQASNITFLPSLSSDELLNEYISIQSLPVEKRVESLNLWKSKVGRWSVLVSCA